ncbi:hypothetical protein NEOLEDRAFT_817241 [Neolentinus lepideus HHB14362 ss-1]|uniref:Uncharacterized protein n=1 Tax=Neolentinus lepideus HHB14362 ss-1 TaxID=1314782 RepID=A0A165PD48_9AGAM|nr:hypothetical protein NEOLEDRAFT_817241 [Neolentinus lepideus HHB14362 ss-1]
MGGKRGELSRLMVRLSLSILHTVIEPTAAGQSHYTPAKRLPTQHAHAPPIQQSVSHPPSTTRHQPSSSKYNTLPRLPRPASTASTVPIPVPPPGFSKSLSQSSDGRSHVRSSSVPFPNGQGPTRALDTRYLESRSVGGDGIGAGSTGGVPMSILESTGSVIGRNERRRAAGPSGHSRMASDGGERREVQANGHAVASRGLSPVAGSVNTDKASVIGTEVTGNWYMIKDPGQVPTTRRQSRPQNRRTLTKPPPGSGGRRSRSQSVSSTTSAKGKEKERSPVSPIGRSKPKDKPLPAPPSQSPRPPPSNVSHTPSVHAGNYINPTDIDQRRPSTRTRSASTPTVPTFGLHFGRRRPSQGELHEGEAKGSKGRPFFRRFFSASLDRGRTLEDVEAARADFQDAPRRLLKSRPGLASVPGFGPGMATSGHSQAQSDGSQRPGPRPRSHSLDSGSFVIMSPPASLVNVPTRWRGPPTTVAPSTYHGSEYAAGPVRRAAPGPVSPPTSKVANPPSRSIMSLVPENARAMNGVLPGTSNNQGHGQSHQANGVPNGHGRNHPLAQHPSVDPPSRPPSLQSINQRLPFSSRDYDVHPVKPLGRARAGSQVSVASFAGTEQTAGPVRRSSSVRSTTRTQPSRSLAAWLKSGFAAAGRRRRGSESQAKEVDPADTINNASPNGPEPENLRSTTALDSHPVSRFGVSGAAVSQIQNTVTLPSATSRQRELNDPTSAPAAHAPRLHLPSASPSEVSRDRDNAIPLSRPSKNVAPPSRADFARLYTTTVPTPPPKSPAPRGVPTQPASTVTSDSRFPHPARTPQPAMAPTSSRTAAAPVRSSSMREQTSTISRQPRTMAPQFYEDRSRKSIGGASQVSWNMKPITIPVPHEGSSYGNLPKQPANSSAGGTSQAHYYVQQSPQQPQASTSAAVQYSVPYQKPPSSSSSAVNPQVLVPRGLYRQSPSVPSNYTYSNSLLERPSLANGANGEARTVPQPQTDAGEAETNAPVIPDRTAKTPFLKRFLGRGKGAEDIDDGIANPKDTKKSRRGLSAESAAWR